LQGALAERAMSPRSFTHDRVDRAFGAQAGGLAGPAMNGKAMNFKAFSALPAIKLILAPG
jgi:hypothetical protein